jgi:hypothetical protein
MLGSGPVHDAIMSVGLLVCTVLALMIIRGRSLLTRLAVESLLLVAIGAFLLSQGTSPLPQGASVLIDRDKAWFRALAVIWWLIGARLAVTVTVVARGIGVLRTAK